MEDEKITKKDIEEIVEGGIEKFAYLVNQGFTEQTKLINNLDTKIDSIKDELNTKINNLDTKIDSIKDELNTKLDNVRSEIIGSNDNIAKEIQDMRAEQAAIIGGNQRANDTLLDHEDRIEKLEIHTKLKHAEVIV